MPRRWAAPVALATALFWFSGCGSSTPTPNPTPQITGLFPSEITAGSQAFTLFVSGTQFISTSTAQWNGSDRPTVYNAASTQLAVSITAADVQNAGLGEVTVTSPAPGGGTSLAVSFTINPAHSGGPTITSLSPSSAGLNGPAFTLTVNGSNFTSGDYVTWNGGLRDTTFVNSTQVTAQILASDLTENITASVAVHTSQLGTASPSASFQVGNAPNSNAKFPQVISTSALGGAADGFSSSPAMSADGRYIAFYSEAKNLVLRRIPVKSVGHIFVRDTCLDATGCVPQTVAVDTALDGSAANGTAADQVAMSADGRYVAFTSSATNLTSGIVPGGPEPRVYVRDLCVGSFALLGCTPRTESVSVGVDGRAINGAAASISADGRYVAFTAPATGNGNLVMVRDTCRGTTARAGCTPQSLTASVSGEDVIAVDPDTQAAISASGRYVAFASNKDGQGHAQIFLRDTCLGVSEAESCLPSTTRVSVGQDGQMGNADSGSPSISGDGRFVVFQSAASNLGEGSSGVEQIYLRDTCAGPTAPLGCQPSTAVVSSEIAPGSAEGSYSPSISASGRYISYIVQTWAQNAASLSGTVGYIAVYDTCFGATGACSPRAAGLAAANPDGAGSILTGDVSVRVPLANDGRLAAFFTRQAVPAVRTSGFGDVLLTTTPFQTRP
jgi:trimeric autotransporter adhesin